MVLTAVFEAGSFVINQRGAMIEGSISRAMYCDHIEVRSLPHIYIRHSIFSSLSTTCHQHTSLVSTGNLLQKAPPDILHKLSSSVQHPSLCKCSFWKMF